MLEPPELEGQHQYWLAPDERDLWLTLAVECQVTEEPQEHSRVPDMLGAEINSVAEAFQWALAMSFDGDWSDQRAHLRELAGLLAKFSQETEFRTTVLMILRK